MKKSILNSLDRLMMRISASGKPITQIFNDDKIIYDKISNEVFLLKSRIDHVQLRIVYSLKMIESEYVIYLIDVITKKKNTKSYINELNKKYRSCRLTDMEFNKICA